MSRRLTDVNSRGKVDLDGLRIELHWCIISEWPHSTSSKSRQKKGEGLFCERRGRLIWTKDLEEMREEALEAWKRTR